MAFQAQQAPNYQGAASDMGGHLASMGKSNLTYALAKRARDEKRADIKLQKEKDERSFILGNISEGLGIMRENTLLKREDKQKAQIQENWKALEPERISKLHNSLNKEWSIEYAQKQRELNRINSAAAKEHADDPSSMGVVFQPIPMSEYLRTNPLIAKRHTLAEAAQRYHGGIGGEEAGVLKGASTEAEAVNEISAEESKRKLQDDIKKFNEESQEKAEAVRKARVLQRDHEKKMEESKAKRRALWLKKTEKADTGGRVTNIKGRADQKRREAIRKHKQKQKEEAEAKKERQEVVAKSKRRSKAESIVKRAKTTAQRKREARKSDARKKAADRIVKSSKIRFGVKKEKERKAYVKREMDKWSKEFGAVADQNVEERKAAEQAKREAVAKRIVTGSQVKRRAEEMGAKREEADAARKAEREKSAKRTVAASAAIRKAEKSKEQRLKKERQAKAQETIETSKRKRKAESIMEKIKQEKQKEQEAAATSLREKAAAADDQLEQQFKAQVGEYKGVREKEKKGKENDNREAAANKDVWGKDQIKKYYTKERDGNFLPSAEAMKDDPNAEKKPLSHWIEKEDTDDGGEWEGVTKNPVQFFLKNPDKLKNLSKNNRKTMLKKMSKYFEDTKTKKGYKPWEVNVGKSPSERIIEE